LCRLVEIMTDTSQDARGYDLPGQVDADFEDDDAARRGTVDILERRFDVMRFDGVLRL